MDTTEDGLSDRQQYDGWEIHYTNSTATTIGYLQALEAEEEVASEDDAPLIAHFESNRVDANPLLVDTSGDGLSDAEEFELGTNPWTTDTTGDGLPDRVALEDPFMDPTLFSIVPPDVEVTYLRAESHANFTWEYDLHYTVSDYSGVAEVEITKDGDRKDYYPYYSRYPTEKSERTQFTTRWEGVKGAFFGTTITAHAKDRYGNRGQTLLYDRSSFYGEAARELGHDSYLAIGAAYPLGMFAGFSYGFAEQMQFLASLVGYLDDPLDAVVRLFKLFISFPGKIAAAIDRLIEFLKVEGLYDGLRQVVHAMFVEPQQRDNPHPAGALANGTYAVGWYRGYIAFFVLEMVVGTKGLSKLKDVKQFSQAVDRVVSTGSEVKATIGAMKGVGASQRMAVKMASRTKQVPVEVLTRVKTAGQRVQLSYQMRQVDSRHLQALRASERATLASDELVGQQSVFEDASVCIDDWNGGSVVN